MGNGKWASGSFLNDAFVTNALKINVNELLSGECLTASEYKEKAEENMMNLMNEKEESKRKIILSVILCALTILSSVTMFVLSGALEIELWLRILLLLIGTIVVIGGIGVVIALDVTTGTYECPKCNTRFVPTTSAYISGLHTFTKRKLKCLYCGQWIIQTQKRNDTISVYGYAMR